MTESTTTLTCRDCGTAITRQRVGKPKLLCPSCLLESQRKASRESHRRKRDSARPAPVEIFCIDCPSSLGIHERGKRPLRCGPCKSAKNREYQRQLREANPRPEREFRCETCGGVAVRKGNSGLQRYCPPCRMKAERRNAKRADVKRAPSRRRTRPPTTPCIECGTARPTPRCGPLTIRCTECATRRAKKQMKALRISHQHMRRARKKRVEYESFQRAEILERDGWRCGVCRKRINPALRFPHLMSASLDHKIPLSRGGGHTRANCQAAHFRCNNRKRARIENVQLALIG